jgi:hypothetical protein
VTWTAYYATTADTFGTLASPTRTQISTGTFTVTSTLTNYSAQISIPAAATTGIEVVFTVGAQTSGTWVIGNVQLEKGSTATSFDYRPYGTELNLCHRYYEETNNNRSVEFQVQCITNGLTTTRFQVRKRATPTVTVYSSVTGVAGTVNNGNGNVQTSITSISQWPDCFAIQMTGTTSQVYTYFWAATAEL